MREVDDVMTWLEGEIAEVDLLEDGDFKKIMKFWTEKEKRSVNLLLWL